MLSNRMKLYNNLKAENRTLREINNFVYVATCYKCNFIWNLDEATAKKLYIKLYNG